MNNLKNYVAEDGEYIIPVTWRVYSTVVIKGVKNLEEAIQVAKEYYDDFQLGESEYIDGTYELEMIDDEYYMINAQEFSKIGGVSFYNPNAED